MRRLEKTRNRPGPRDKEERRERHGNFKERFLSIMGPYLENSHLEVTNFFAGYGDSRQILVETPPYSLFGNDDDGKDAFMIKAWFLAKDEGLSCKSHLEYFDWASNNKRNDLRRGLLEDLYLRAMEGSNVDGENFSLVKRSGFFYFAPLYLAHSTMLGFKEIIERVGEGALSELGNLRGDYLDSIRSYEPTERDVRQSKIFKEAYESALEGRLKEVGLVGDEFSDAQDSAKDSGRGSFH